jgi:hypothetical protein
VGRGASLSRVVSRGWLAGVTDLGAWDALTPDEVASLFAGLAEPWWLAGAIARCSPGHPWLDRLS